MTVVIGQAVALLMENDGPEAGTVTGGGYGKGDDAQGR